MTHAAPRQGAPVLAPYYPTSTRLVLSRDEKSDTAVDAAAALPATTWTSCVPYLRSFDMSSMTVIYQPPSVVQLRHAGAVFVDSIAEIYGKLPRITLVEEVGPYARHHRDNNGGDDVREFGLLRAPPAIDWYSRTKDAVQQHPRPTAEEEEYEKEFYRRIEGQREKAKKAKEQRKRLRRQSANKHSLRHASVSSVAGTSAVLAATTTAAMANAASVTATDDSLGSPSYRSERAGLSLPNSPFDVEGSGGAGASAPAVGHTTTTMTTTNVTGSRPSPEGNAGEGVANAAQVTMTSNTNAQRTAKGLLRRARYNAHRTASPSLLLRQQQLALPAGPYYQNLISPLSVLSARGGSVYGDGSGAGGFRFPALSSTTSEVSQMTDFNASVAGSSGGTPTMASEGVVVGGTKTAGMTPAAAGAAGVGGGSGAGYGYMSSSSQLFGSSSTAGLSLPAATPPSRLVYATQLPCTVSRVTPAPVPAGHVSPPVAVTPPANATRESPAWTHTVVSSNAGRAEQQVRPTAHVVACAPHEEPRRVTHDHRQQQQQQSGAEPLPHGAQPAAPRAAHAAPQPAQHVTHQLSAQATQRSSEGVDEGRRGPGAHARAGEHGAACAPPAVGRAKPPGAPPSLPQQHTNGSAQATAPHHPALAHRAAAPAAVLPAAEDKEGGSYQRSSTSSSSTMARAVYRPARQPSTARPGEHAARPQRLASNSHSTSPTPVTRQAHNASAAAPSPPPKDDDLALPPRKGGPPRRLARPTTTVTTTSTNKTVSQSHTTTPTKPPTAAMQMAKPASHHAASASASESSADEAAAALVPSCSTSGMTDPPRRLVTAPPPLGGSVSHAETMASLSSLTHSTTPQPADTSAARATSGTRHGSSNVSFVQSPARAMGGAAAVTSEAGTEHPLPQQQQQGPQTRTALDDRSSLPTTLPSVGTEPAYGTQRWLSDSRNDSCSPALMPLALPVVELIEPVVYTAPAPPSGVIPLPPPASTADEDTASSSAAPAATTAQPETQLARPITAAATLPYTTHTASAAQTVALPASAPPVVTHVPAAVLPANGTTSAPPPPLPSTAGNSVTSVLNTDAKASVTLRPAAMSTGPMVATQYAMTEADAAAKLNGTTAAATPVIQRHHDKATTKCCVVM